MEEKFNILVVDDEEMICQAVIAYFTAKGYTVFTANNGKKAVDVFSTENIDFVILDLMLPEMTGEEVCEHLRTVSSVPILMLTAKTGDDDIVNGLNIGADDYMTKPFDLHELLARIEANLKRTSNTSCQNDTLTYRDIEINNSLVYIKEVLVSFTSTELKILRLLLQYPQKIFSKQNLYESIWNKTYAYDDDTINTHISHIREKN